MFDELDKYKETGHFFFESQDDLSQVCNAPTDKSGVYLVYALKHGKIELVYIGRSGKLMPNGSMFIRKAGLGGIKDRIVNGHQFGKVSRRVSWPIVMNSEKIDALDIYWFVTHSKMYNDCPREIESYLLKMFLSSYGQLPRWNHEI
jgi:hypothetical protein